MAFSDKLDEDIKALEAQREHLPRMFSDWHNKLSVDDSDAKMAALAQWALEEISNEWQIAAITAAMSEDDLNECEAWIEDMIDTRQGIDGPG